MTAAQRFTNVSNLPLALAAFLASDDYDYDPTPNTISATTLMKPLRQIILADRLAQKAALEPTSITLPDIMDRAANRMGASIHNSIEMVWKDPGRRNSALLALGLPAGVIRKVVVNPEDDYVRAHPDCIPVYMEQRLRRKIGKWTVTGKFDFVAEQQVQDFKTANVLSYKKQRNADKQILQGSLYRWLDAGQPLRKITKPTMVILHMFMDWMAAMARNNSDYPPHRMMKQILELKSEQETDNWVKNKLALIEKYWDAPEEEIPECEGEDLWRSEPNFKYYKSGDINAKRSTKNFDTRTEAYTYMAVDMGGIGAVKEVPGTVKACHYCNSFDVCSQKDRLIASGELEVGQ